MDDFYRIKNGVALPRADLPRVSFPRFFRLLSDLVRCNGYLVQFFVHPEGERNLLIAVARTSNLLVLTTEVEREFPSLTLAGGAKFNCSSTETAPSSMAWPGRPPWLKTVRYHANRTGRPDVFGNDYRADIPGNTPSTGVAASRHEVAGAKAGGTEPGYLLPVRCEEVLHLEIQLGYQRTAAVAWNSRSPVCRSAGCRCWPSPSPATPPSAAATSKLLRQLRRGPGHAEGAELESAHRAHHRA